MRSEERRVGKECDFLLSEEGTKAIVELHTNGIINYIKKVKNA